MGVGTMAAILVGMVVSLARPAQVRDLLDQTKEPFFDLTANTVFTGQMQFVWIHLIVRNQMDNITRISLLTNSGISSSYGPDFLEVLHRDFLKLVLSWKNYDHRYSY